MDQLGEIPIEREDGTMRIMVFQMGGCAGKEVREIKMSTMEKLIRKYNINLAAFMELNFNWSKVNSSANLASWLHQEERETRSVTAHNMQPRALLQCVRMAMEMAHDRGTLFRCYHHF